MKVLIVDDDSDCLKINVELAEPYCDEIITATNGIDGLCQFKKKVFDIVITDFQMPFMDGERFAANIREGGSDVPIMLVSGLCSAVKDVSLFNWMVSKGEFETYKAILEEHLEMLLNLTLETYEKTLDNFGRPKETFKNK